MCAFFIFHMSSILDSPSGLANGAFEEADLRATWRSILSQAPLPPRHLITSLTLRGLPLALRASIWHRFATSGVAIPPFEPTDEGVPARFKTVIGHDVR
jgi:hypothetical protein